MESYEQSCRPIALKSRKMFEDVSSLFSLKDTDRKTKLTTGESLFGTDDAKKPRLHEKENIEQTDASAATAGAGDSDAITTAASSETTKKKITVQHVGTVSPVEDFKQIVEHQIQTFDMACNELRDQISQFILNSYGDSLYTKALSCLLALREACITKLEPNIYNQFLKKLKEWLPLVIKTTFWDKIKEEKLTLISSNECIESNVFQVEAEKFLEDDAQSDALLNKATTADGGAQDEEDLFDLI